MIGLFYLKRKKNWSLKIGEKLRFDFVKLIQQSQFHYEIRTTNKEYDMITQRKTA